MPIVLFVGSTGLGGGSDVSLPGTGLAVPRGVEAIWQYNNLTLNDRDVVDKFRIIDIDGLDDADVRDAREENPASDGETAYDAHYGGRTIAIRGRVEAYELNKMRDMQQALRDAFMSLEEIPLYCITGDPAKDHYIMCRKFSKNQWGDEQRHANHFFRDFLITLRASNPRWLRQRQKLQFIETADIDPDATFIITNDGNFNSQATIKFYGQLDDVEIMNLSDVDHNGDPKTLKFKTTVTIADADVYEVNFANRSVRNAAGVNKFFDLHSDTSLFNLVPGANELKLGASIAAGANAAIEIRHRDSWL